MMKTPLSVIIRSHWEHDLVNLHMTHVDGHAMLHDATTLYTFLGFGCGVMQGFHYE